MNLNKVMLIGNLTQDPEVRTIPSGHTVATFGLATNRVWNDQQGQKQEKVEFHNIVIWRRLAEICGQYLQKGSKIYIEGRLETRNWVGQDGVKRYKTEIIAENMIMLDRANNNSMSQNTGNSFGNSEPDPSFSTDSSDNSSDMNSVNNAIPKEEEIKIEDIPF